MTAQPYFTKVTSSSFFVVLILFVLVFATTGNALMVTCYQSTIASNATVTISPSIINQCTVSAYLIVDVVSMNTNAGAGTTPLDFTINATTIASPYHLVINGFTTAADAKAATHPLYATITLSTFVNGMIALNDQYPPRSIINVHHNDLNQISSAVFSSLPPHQHFVGAVRVGLYGGSKLLIEHNTISVSYVYISSLQCLMIIGSYALDDESLWSLSNNIIDVLNPTADALGLYIYKSTTTAVISNYSRLLYGDNNVQILSPRIAAFFIAQNLPQLYYNGSTVEIMTNTVAVSGGTGKNCGFSLDYWANGAVMTASLNSRIIVEGNVIQMNSTGGSINGISLGNTQMTLGSEFSVSNNVFYMAQNATVVIGVEFKLNITLSSGNININSNRMITCSNSLGMAYVTTGYSFGVSSGGQFLFTRNVIEEASTCVTTGALPPLLYGPVVPTGTGVFFLCPWNRYGGKMVYNPQKDYTTAMVSSYAQATDACFTLSSSISKSLQPTLSKSLPPTDTQTPTTTLKPTNSLTLPTTPSLSVTTTGAHTPSDAVSSTNSLPPTPSLSPTPSIPSSESPSRTPSPLPTPTVVGTGSTSLSRTVSGMTPSNARTASESLPPTKTAGPIPTPSRTITTLKTPSTTIAATPSVPHTTSNPHTPSPSLIATTTNHFIPTTTPQVRLITSTIVVNNTSLDGLRETSSGITQSSSSGAAAVMVVGGLSIEAQILLALLSIDCDTASTPGGSSSTWDWSRVGYAKYLVSPFIDLGPSWAVVGAVCVGVGVMIVHGVVWALLHTCYFQKGTATSTIAVSQGRVLFPGASLVVVRMLVVGVSAHVVEILSTDNLINETTIGKVAAALGIIFCLAVVCGHFVCLWLSSATSGGMSFRDDDNDTQKEHTQRPAKQSTLLKRVFLQERGSWQPTDKSGRVAGVITPYVGGGYRRVIGTVPPLICIIACLMMGLGGCPGGFIGVGTIALLMSILHFATRALRSDVQTFLTSLCYVLLALSCIWEAVASWGAMTLDIIYNLREGTMFALFAFIAVRQVHCVVLWAAPRFGCVTTTHHHDRRNNNGLQSVSHNTQHDLDLDQLERSDLNAVPAESIADGSPKDYNIAEDEMMVGVDEINYFDAGDSTTHATRTHSLQTSYQYLVVPDASAAAETGGDGAAVTPTLSRQSSRPRTARSYSPDSIGTRGGSETFDKY